MNRSDWLEYFEAINGRPATGEELAAAMENGEIVDVAPSQPQATQATATVAPEAAQTNQVPPVQPEAAQQGQVPPAPQAAPLVSPERQEQMKQTSRDFWNWLVSAWKNPLSVAETKPVNGWLAFLLLSVMFTLPIFILTRRSVEAFGVSLSSLSQAFGTNTGYTNPIGFQVFISLLLAVAFILFALIFAGFVTRRFVYQEANFTLNQAMESYGRLLAINNVVMAVATLFAFIIPINSMNEDSLTIFAYILGIAVFILMAGATYSLANFQIVNEKINKFYLYLAGLVVNAVVLYIFGAIARTFVENYVSNMLNSLF